MRLYDTLSRDLKNIEPQNPAVTTVYTCGPTVYDYQTVGNWFTYVRYDLLIRTLKITGQQPKWALNITDVGHLVSDADTGEDKLEKGAKREGKTAWEVAEFYTKDFLDGLRKLNITEPSFLPRATQHIAEQIDLIKQLEQKGYTYVIDDGVYYDTAKFPRYADFARLDIDEQEAGKRVDFNPQKRNISDFALWKFSPKDKQRDMDWDSPWGKGFPGWHIECSAMARKYLGDTIDIHSGGIDHLAVHHTNEIAQTEAATGKPLARHWMHTNHILVEGQKISKSLGNGVSLQDIEQKGYKLEALRLLVLQSHYRTQSQFTWEALDGAQNRLQAYKAMAALRWQTVSTTDKPAVIMPYIESLVEAMEDDLNTPEFLSQLSALENVLSASLLQEDSLEDFIKLLETIDQLSGLQLSLESDITDEQKSLIKQRTDARQNENWNKADEVRQTLEEQGILIRDTHAGPIWYRN